MKESKPISGITLDFELKTWLRVATDDSKARQKLLDEADIQAHCKVMSRAKKRKQIITFEQLVKNYGGICYAVLRGQKLEIYDDDNSTLSKTPVPLWAMDLVNYTVSLYPENLSKSAAWNRKFPLLLKQTSETVTLFIYFSNGPDKELWYGRLKSIAQPSPSTAENSQSEKKYTEAVSNLVRWVHQRPDTAQLETQSKPLPPIREGDPSTQWFNAIFGRIFLTARSSKALNIYLMLVFQKKLSAMKRPGLLGPLTLRKLEVGENMPLIYNAFLQNLTLAGEMEVAFDVVYHGGLCAHIGTTVVLDTGLGSIGSISLELSVSLNYFCARVVARMPPPPSDRLWFGLVDVPKLSLVTQPVLSDTKINFTMVQQAIESRILEVIKNDLVLPQMECITIGDLSEDDNSKDLIKIPSFMSSKPSSAGGSPCESPNSRSSKKEYGLSNLSNSSKLAKKTKKYEQDLIQTESLQKTTRPEELNSLTTPITKITTEPDALFVPSMEVTFDSSKVESSPEVDKVQIVLAEKQALLSLLGPMEP